MRTASRKHSGALPEDDALTRWKIDWISRAGAHLMGRTTYQEMSSVWPQSTRPYAAVMNETRRWSFPTVDDSAATWPSTRVARGDLASGIAAIKAQPGPDVIAWGGATFAAALAAEGLIDEYRLAVQPVATGTGQPLFGRLPAPLFLDLTETKSFACGVVVHVHGRGNPERPLP